MCIPGTSDPNPQLSDPMAVCGHLVADDSVHWFLAENRLIVLQALECLSDLRSDAQLRMNTAWKVAAGQPLHDKGFHPSH